MRINIEELSTALDIIISTNTYDEAIAEIKSRLPNYRDNVEDIILLFLNAFTLYFSNPLVGKWDDPNLLIDYDTARNILINTKLSSSELAKYLSFSIATIFMQALLEPVYIIENNKIIFTATNMTIEKLYEIRKQIELYNKLLAERHSELESQVETLAVKYNTDPKNLVEDILSLDLENLADYYGIKTKIDSLESQYDELLKEMNNGADNLN